MMNGPSQSLIHEYVLLISKVRVEFSVLSQKFPFFHPFTHSFTQSIYFFSVSPNTRHFIRHWEYSNERKRQNFLSSRLCILTENLVGLMFSVSVFEKHWQNIHRLFQNLNRVIGNI